MHFRALSYGLCCLCLTTPLPVAAEQPSEPPPCGSPVAVPEKPLLDDYTDYTDFLVRIMEYKQALRERDAHKLACPDDYQPHHVASTDPTVIDGPETLGEALERTRRLTQLDYSEHPTWHDRSTAKSFALPPLSAPGLSAERLQTLLGNANTNDPLILPLSLLNLQLNGINDGKDAQAGTELLRFQGLSKEEQDAALAWFLAENSGAVWGLESNGNLTFYLNRENQYIRTHAFIEWEDCLSSCVED